VPTNGVPPSGSYGHPAELVALDAESAVILWRGPIGANPHWACPTVAGGKVFVPNGISELDIFSLRPPIFVPFPVPSPLPTIASP